MYCFEFSIQQQTNAKQEKKTLIDYGSDFIRTDSHQIKHECIFMAMKFPRKYLWTWSGGLFFHCKENRTLQITPLH